MHSNASRTFEVQLKRITRVIAHACAVSAFLLGPFSGCVQKRFPHFSYLQTFFTKLHNLHQIWPLLSAGLGLFLSALPKNESLTTHWEVFQGFRFFGDSQTSHDSKNRCVTWLRLDLYCIISQSVSRSTCAHRREHCMLSPQGSAFVLLKSLRLFSCPVRNLFFFSCGVLLVEVLAAVEGALGVVVGGGGGWLDSCFPSVLESSSRPVAA